MNVKESIKLIGVVIGIMAAACIVGHLFIKFIWLCYYLGIKM